MEELRSDVDIHSENQKAFDLPSRGIAKILKFRILYGGSAYSFSIDPDFTSVSKKVSYWENAIEKYYEKYKGLANWHRQLLKQATTGGLYTSPFGREYKYEPKKNWKGDLVWPDTDIKNYPVQGCGADVMAVARVAAHSRAKRAKLTGLFINSVHDSIEIDAPSKEQDAWVELLDKVFKDLPMLVTKAYGVEWNVPMCGETSVGPNRSELIEVKI